MSGAGGSNRLHNVSDLLAYLQVESLEQASDLITEETDPDAFILEENGEFVIRMGTLGSMLEFPITVDDFWELVHDLEDDVVATFDADSVNDVVDADFPGWDSPA